MFSRTVTIILFLFIVCKTMNSQVMHFDPAVTSALYFNGSYLKSEQNETNNELRTLNRKQTTVALVLAKINKNYQKTPTKCIKIRLKELM